MSFVTAFIAVSGTQRRACTYSGDITSGSLNGYEYYKFGSSGAGTNVYYRTSDASLCVVYDPTDLSQPLLVQSGVTFPHTRSSAGYVTCTISKAWRLDVTKQTGGTISVTTGGDKVAVGTNYVESGVAVTLQVDSLSDGYVFSGWYLNGSLVGTEPTYSFTTGTADAAVQARFRYTRHTLTVTPSVGATVKVEVDTGSGYVTLVEALASANSFTEIPENSNVRLTPTLPYYATFTNWTTDVLGTISVQTALFAMPTSNASLTLVAPANDTYTLTITNATPTYGSFVVRRQSNSEVVYTDNGSGAAQNVTLYKGVYYETLATSANALLYIFVDWVIGATHVTTNPLTLYIPTASGTTSTARVCNFDAVPTYTIATNVSDSSTYTPGNAAETAGNTVTVVTAPNSGSEYVKNTLVRVVASSVGQWTFTGWHIVYGGGGTTDLPGNQTLDFQISDDTTLTAIFVPTKYTVELTTDAVTQAAAAGTVELQESDLTPMSNPSDVIHGTLLRAVATAASGYAFEGWYKNGVKIEGANAVYYFTAVENVTLQAKFTAPVPLSVDNAGSASGAAWFVTEAGENIAQAPTTINVILGENFYIKYVLLSPETLFRGVDDDGTPVFIDQTTNPLVGTCVDTGHDYTVSFDTTSGTLVYLRMTNDPIGVENSGLGSLLATGCVAELSREEYIAAMGMYAGSGGIPTIGEGRNRYFSFEKYAIGSISAVPLTTRTFKKWTVSDVEVLDGIPYYNNERDLSVNNPAELSVYGNISVLAVWTSGVPSLVSALYADGYDSTQGSIILSPTGLNRVESALGVQAEFLASDTVVLSAVPANGYKFAGWYSDYAATALVSANTTLTLTDVEAPVTRYAKFVQDANAVYVWEGGAVPKYQTWRSKRLEASAPFDPACVRVLADGYPVVLKIYACSSPNSPSPTVPTKSLTLMNQDGMRLPSARKERYFEIEVSSSYAINDIVMSTSMGGLTQ